MAAPKGNQYAVGNNGGHPPHYREPAELIAKIDEYFLYVQGEFHEEKKQVKDPDTGKEAEESFKVWDRYPEPLTVTGLCLFLGFASRSSMVDYEKRGEEFSHVVKRARLRVEHEYELCLRNDKPTGAIFALKNMGWSDRMDVTSDDKPLGSAVMAVRIIPPLPDDE